MSFCGVTVTANKLANLPICHGSDESSDFRSISRDQAVVVVSEAWQCVATSASWRRQNRVSGRRARDCRIPVEVRTIRGSHVAGRRAAAPELCRRTRQRRGAIFFTRSASR